jgi:hypothetical protein
MLYRLSYVRAPLRLTDCAAEPRSKSLLVYPRSTSLDRVKPVAPVF